MQRDATLHTQVVGGTPLDEIAIGPQEPAAAERSPPLVGERGDQLALGAGRVRGQPASELDEFSPVVSW